MHRHLDRTRFERCLCVCLGLRYVSPACPCTRRTRHSTSAGLEAGGQGECSLSVLADRPFLPALLPPPFSNRLDPSIPRRQRPPSLTDVIARIACGGGAARCLRSCACDTITPRPLSNVFPRRCRCQPRPQCRRASHGEVPLPQANPYTPRRCTLARMHLQVLHPFGSVVLVRVGRSMASQRLRRRMVVRDEEDVSETSLRPPCSLLQD